MSYSQGGNRGTQEAFELPITMTKKLYEGAIHIGSQFDVNIISNSNFYKSNHTACFMSDYIANNGQVLIWWIVIGIIV